MKTKWIVLAGLLAVITVAILVLPRFARKNLELPRSLGSLELREETRGEKARSMINTMHGKSVTPMDNMIGVYANRNGTATVYLSLYASQRQSEETVQQMVRGIEKGTSPFSDFTRLTIQGQDVSFCIGFGQAHSFFFVDESVYWLTADPAVADEAVAKLLQALRGSSIQV